jgi:hypothetical protein
MNCCAHRHAELLIAVPACNPTITPVFLFETLVGGRRAAAKGVSDSGIRDLSCLIDQLRK